MAKKENKNLNYYKGRVGFKGEYIAIVATKKSLSQIQEQYNTWQWAMSNKEDFDSLTVKAQRVNGQ